MLTKNKAAPETSEEIPNPRRRLRLTNYNMALGRVLGVVILGPLFLGLAMLSLNDGASAGMVVAVIVLLFAEMWLAYSAWNAVFWMEFDDSISIRRLFGVVQVASEEVKQVEWDWEPGFLELPTVLKMVLRSGKRFVIKVNAKDASMLQTFLSTPDRSSKVRKCLAALDRSRGRGSESRDGNKEPKNTGSRNAGDSPDEGSEAKPGTMLAVFGILCLLLGVLSAVLSLMGLELKLLWFVSRLADATAWTFRVGLILIGGVMWIVGKQAARR